jgi:hypothetical protein
MTLPFIQTNLDDPFLSKEPLLQYVYGYHENPRTDETGENLGQTIENENCDGTDQKKCSVPEKSSIDGVYESPEFRGKSCGDDHRGYGHEERDAVPNYPLIGKSILVHPISEPLIHHEVP